MYKLVCGREIGTFCQKIPNFGHTDTGGARTGTGVGPLPYIRGRSMDPWGQLLGPARSVVGPRGGPKTIYTTYCTVSVCKQIKWASN